MVLEHSKVQGIYIGSGRNSKEEIVSRFVEILIKCVIQVLYHYYFVKIVLLISYSFLMRF